MPQVQTVLGPVDAGALGRTLMHEHVFVLTAEVQQNYPREWGDEDARVTDAVRRTGHRGQAARRAGRVLVTMRAAKLAL